jgi:antitoxin (DNA-binding transcriptional repressor) of toxin-antitoxin stability system
MKVSVQYAESHFPDLVEAASNGIEVEIALPEKPSLKLVTTGIAPTPKQEGRRILGLGRGQMRPVSDEEWESMKQQMQDQMLSPLMTTGEV